MATQSGTPVVGMAMERLWVDQLRREHAVLLKKSEDVLTELHAYVENSSNKFGDINQLIIGLQSRYVELERNVSSKMSRIDAEYDKKLDEAVTIVKKDLTRHISAGQDVAPWF